jgi:hypothetical protein
VLGGSLVVGGLFSDVSLSDTALSYVELSQWFRGGLIEHCSVR